ncbi:MAG: hypothetical protein E7479_00755 [Ruminococcaceae bacterium]|nr:hypothetical protein [Oscillospiraceae bacterium]
MDKKIVIDTVIKNRFLIIICIMLVFGTIFGTSMLGYLPEEICLNIFDFISSDSENFINDFINSFSFPFLILLGLYFSGSSILGTISVPFIIFIYGAFTGFENAVKYSILGADYIVNGMILYFCGALYFGFIIIVMAESSIFSSKKLKACIKDINAEKPHYNAKKQAVKFVGFTACFAIISLISVCFTRFIQSVL